MLLEADARLVEEVTNKLAKAVRPFTEEGVVEDVPAPAIVTSIGDALDAVTSVSKAS